METISLLKINFIKGVDVCVWKGVSEYVGYGVGDLEANDVGGGITGVGRGVAVGSIPSQSWNISLTNSSTEERSCPIMNESILNLVNPRIVTMCSLSSRL